MKKNTLSITKYLIGLVVVNIILFLNSCNKENEASGFQLNAINYNNLSLNSDKENNISYRENPIFDASFNKPINISSTSNNIILYNSNYSTKSLAKVDETTNPNQLTISFNTKLFINTDYHLVFTKKIKDTEGNNLLSDTLNFRLIQEVFSLIDIEVNSKSYSNNSKVPNITSSSRINLNFSQDVDAKKLKSEMQLRSVYHAVDWSLEPNTGISKRFQISLNNLESYDKLSLTLPTSLTSTTSAALNEQAAIQLFGQAIKTNSENISDDQLMDIVQKNTLNYFIKYSHPKSGMIQERNTSGELVTTGGTGFGIMALIVGIERKFISEEMAMSQIRNIVNYLKVADRFHGAWPHWLNGSTGKVIPFSTRDNGADLVETSYLAMGLISAREYIATKSLNYSDIATNIDKLLSDIEWNWYDKGGNSTLYWHWSPNYNWEMNLPIVGYNECLITYVLAASNDHSIEKSVYTNGWLKNGTIKNNQTWYNIPLQAGPSQGGPLFFSHYSYMGLDPHNLIDQHLDYWLQGVNHSLINYQHCVANPNKYAGYSENIWGLTASDTYDGYTAHSPNNDRGVISPTAALSSIVYTPENSLRAMRHFYEYLGNRTFTDVGFIDAFSIDRAWYASSTLAIDQGPIVVMIENYRSQLLWNLFMNAKEVKTALSRLGFKNYSQSTYLRKTNSK